MTPEQIAGLKGQRQENVEESRDEQAAAPLSSFEPKDSSPAFIPPAIPVPDNSTQNQPLTPPPPPPPGQVNGTTPNPFLTPRGIGWQRQYPFQPQPPAGELKRYQIAPNGKPYIVADSPEKFYGYKNKEGKQVYAAIATINQRLVAALIDTCIVYFPLQFIAMLTFLIFNPDIQQLLIDGTTSANSQNDLTTQIYSAVPPWVWLLVMTLNLIYCVLMTWLARGQTLGKKIMKLRIIKLDGEKPDFNTALTRNLFGYSWGLGNLFLEYGAFGTLLGFGLEIMVLIGFTAAFGQPQHRGWHDRLAGTIVTAQPVLVQGENY
ncbi:MAG TPA: RDD family protein [Chloroflexia bacterium]|nr:RDD family protein [Chloroflexia bacterium]